MSRASSTPTLSTLTLYVDGAVRATRATDRRPTSNTAPLSLASDADNQTREFDGTIRRARVYARALTTAELADGNRESGDDGVRFWFDAATVRTERRRPEARTFLAYGGDWGDNPNDGAFVADGIVTAERKLGGKAAEIKRVYQAVGATRVPGGGPGARSPSPTSICSPTSATSTAVGSSSRTAR